MTGPRITIEHQPGTSQRTWENPSHESMVMDPQGSPNASPLLQLPREIRDQIYGYVYGKGAVHIHDFLGEEKIITTVERNSHVASTFVEELKARVYHHQCRWVIGLDGCYTTQAAFESFDNDRYRLQYSGYHNNMCCKIEALRILGISQLSPLRDLNLLLTCRLISSEASEVLYSNTAFYFDSWDVLNQFVATTPPSSLLRVHRIGLQIPTGSDVYHKWWSETLLQVSTMMANISHVYIEIVSRLPRMQKPGTFHMPLSEESGLTKGLMHLSHLPLKKATVSIFDQEVADETYRRVRSDYMPWSTKRKLKFLSDLGRRLLHENEDVTDAQVLE